MTPEERAIERVMKALGESTPWDGFEGRVLTKLAERRTVEPAAWFGRRVVRIGAVAVALAVAVAAVTVMHRGQRSSEKFAARDVVAPVAPRQEKALVEADSAKDPEERPAAVTRAMPKRVRVVESSQPAAARRDGELHYRRASFPAPPAPLTEQERLLVSIVTSGRRADFAMLESKPGADADAAE